MQLKITPLDATAALLYPLEFHVGVKLMAKIELFDVRLALENKTEEGAKPVDFAVEDATSNDAMVLDVVSISVEINFCRFTQAMRCF